MSIQLYLQDIKLSLSSFTKFLVSKVLSAGMWGQVTQCPESCHLSHTATPYDPAHFILLCFQFLSH